MVDKEYVSPSQPGPAIESYAKILKLLAETKEGTVLIHCSHGMDRTGVVFDLLYHILGVSEADMLHDYMLSNTSLGVTWATPQLLIGTFNGDIDLEFGSMDEYLTKEIGVTPLEIQKLREEYLVSNPFKFTGVYRWRANELEPELYTAPQA